MKSERLLEEIKLRVDIVEFISDYVTLKKAGQNYKGLCPFHPEKTPSFMVSQSKQIFHCFGCGAGGDVVSFLMKHENLSFAEAIRYLAKKAGIDLKGFKSAEENTYEIREKLIHINEEALKIFRKNLDKSEVAKKYLEDRGLSKESISKFNIGFANDESDDLIKKMKRLGVSYSQLKDAGLVTAFGSGYRDLFRKRIIFPIYNLKNDLIAFGGRVMDNSLPKYINSPETKIFKKGESLFGINVAKEGIKNKNYAIIVEGYLDTIICHQFGFENTIAPLGTALTPMHLQRLKLLTKNVVLIFDSDEAGINAARRSLTAILESAFKVKVLLLPKGDDPDSFLRKNGSKIFERLLDNSMSIIEFLLKTSKAEKSETVRDALNIIASTKDFIVAEEMLNELSDRSRINESILREELEKIKKRFKTDKTTVETKIVRNSFNKEEWLLLSVILSFPDKTNYIFSQLDIEDVNDKIVRSILEKVKSLEANFNIRTLLDKADEKEKELITELSLNPGFDPEHVDKNIEDCLYFLQQRRFEEKRKIAEKNGDIIILDSLLKEKRNLIKRSKHESKF